MYLKKAVKGSIIVFILLLGAAVFSYLFRILLARNLSLAEYGTFYAVYSLFSFFIIFIDLGLSQAVSKHAIDYNTGRKFSISKSIIIIALAIQLTLSIIVFSLVLFFSNNISRTISAEPVMIVLMGIWFLTLPVVSFFGNIFLGRNRPEIATSMEVVRQVTALMFTAFFIYFNFSGKSPFLAYTLINVVMLIVYAPLIRKIFPQFLTAKVKINPSIMKKILKYGTYLTFSSLLAIIITHTDTILLALFKGPESVGLYQIAIPISMVITYVSGAFITVAFPMIAELNARKETTLLTDGIPLLFKYALAFSVPIALAIISFPELAITLLFGIKYIPAAKALIILSISTLIGLIVLINSTIMNAMGHPREIYKSMIAAAILNLVSNIILIPNFDIVGAALSSVAGFSLALAYSSYQIRKKIGISLPKLVVLKIFISSAFAVIFVYLGKQILNMSAIQEALFLGIIATAVYFTSLILLRVVNIPELKQMAEQVLK
jgi:O-antigen/teichoic acid export membrane protein